MSKRSKRKFNLSEDSNKGDNREEVFCMYPLHSKCTVTIYRKDLERLEKGQLFNDTLIDYRVKHLLSDLNNKDSCQRSKVHAFSTQFYTRVNIIFVKLPIFFTFYYSYDYDS